MLVGGKPRAVPPDGGAELPAQHLRSRLHLGSVGGARITRPDRDPTRKLLDPFRQRVRHKIRPGSRNAKAIERLMCGCHLAYLAAEPLERVLGVV